MRIVQLVDSLDCGGAEQVVASLAASQSSHGHSVRVVCLRDLGPYPVDIAALLSAGVEITTLKKPPGFHFDTLRRLARYLETERIEVLHTHNHLVHHYGAVAARWAGTPVVLNTLHGSSSLQMPRWAKGLFWFSCLFSHRVVSVCPQVQADFQKAFRLPLRKYSVVNNGIDLSRFLAIRRRPVGEMVTFGNIGRFDSIKDHDNLLRAFAILKKRQPHVQLRLLGDGALRRGLEQLARSLSVVEDVHFDGFSLDTARFLEQVDVYVIPSRSEGLPLTLLEAMAASLPVVSTAVGAIPDIISRARGGWLCQPSSPDEFADAMEKAVQPGDLATIGASNRKAVAEYYSVERMSRDYDQLYEALLSEQSRD